MKPARCAFFWLRTNCSNGERGYIPSGRPAGPCCSHAVPLLSQLNEHPSVIQVLPEGGFGREPEALQAIVLNSMRSVPLTPNMPPQAFSCDMVKAITALV